MKFRTFSKRVVRGRIYRLKTNPYKWKTLNKQKYWGNSYFWNCERVGLGDNRQIVSAFWETDFILE